MSNLQTCYHFKVDFSAIEQAVFEGSLRLSTHNIGFFYINP